MSYHIYTTDGIILKRTGSGEADIYVHILTRDLGLILAGARSARLSVSKLRPALQEYSRVKVSLIKSKSGWKITNVAESENLFFSGPVHSRRLLVQVSVVLVKMIVGEYPQKDIYELIDRSFSFLKKVDEEDLPNLEVLTVLRVLHRLGYVEGGLLVNRFLQDSEFNKQILTEVVESKKEIVSVINKALKESQL